MTKDSFSKELALIKDGTVRRLTELCLDAAPEKFFTGPASSSGKYHPASSLGEGGLVRHSQLVARYVVNITAPVAAGVTPLGRDCMIAAAVLHDSMKFGRDNQLHTLKEHPLLAANLIDDVFYKSQEELEALWTRDNDSLFEDGPLQVLEGMVKTHMGEWWDFVPTTPLERLFHLCDYLASRKDLNQ